MRLVILAISVKKILTDDFAYIVQNVTEVNSKNTSIETSTLAPEIRAVGNTTTFDINTLLNNITSQISQVSAVLNFYYLTNSQGMFSRKHPQRITRQYFKYSVADSWKEGGIKIDEKLKSKIYCFLNLTLFKDMR